MDSNIVYVGMDLGTFKTSVASSTGTRDVIPSAVGWPRDHIARAMLGRDVVFGKDVLEHRFAMNVVRPFEKGVLKYNDADAAGVPLDQIDRHRKAARLLVKHAVALTRPPQGRPCTASSAPRRGPASSTRASSWKPRRARSTP